MRDNPIIPRLRGFTLTELAIVLVIVGLLIGGMLVPLSAQRDIQNTKETERQLAEVKEALIGFAITSGRLPCPANPALASGAVGAGIEIAPIAGGCTGAVLAGVLPWATLGLPELDVWGRRLSYRVAGGFAQPITGQTAFALGDNGNINVRIAASGTLLASAIPAVVVSHGPNGLGAYLPTGGLMTASTDADEAENTNADDEFVRKTVTPSFDDQVVWVTPNILKNRMVAAQKLP